MSDDGVGLFLAILGILVLLAVVLSLNYFLWEWAWKAAFNVDPPFWTWIAFVATVGGGSAARKS